MTSFAKIISTTPIDAPSPRESFDAVNKTDEEKAAPRNSTMVTNDRPVAAPHPSPDMAGGVDRVAFNAAWEDEARNARREAFKAKRAHQHPQTRQRTFTHAVKR